MTNKNLADDYYKRAVGRQKAIQTLFDEELFADVVRECQEALELVLKGAIRKVGHEVPFSHEVSGKLSQITGDLPSEVVKELDKVTQISKNMRRDRELSFYGSEDITPSEFYTRENAEQAMSELTFVVTLFKAVF